MTQVTTTANQKIHTDQSEQSFWTKVKAWYAAAEAAVDYDEQTQLVNEIRSLRTQVNDLQSRFVALETDSA